MAQAMIDLSALEIEAEGMDGDGDCVVTRRWLRQVLKELRAARGVGPKRVADLDLSIPKLEVRIEPLKGFDYQIPASRAARKSW